MRSQRSRQESSGNSVIPTMPSTPGGTLNSGTRSVLRSAREVVGPHNAGQVGRVQLRQLLEEVQRVHEDAHHVVEGVEVMDTDEAGRVLRGIVEVLVPRPVVDDD